MLFKYAQNILTDNLNEVCYVKKQIGMKNIIKRFTGT